jgi:hypothetical protein
MRGSGNESTELRTDVIAHPEFARMAGVAGCLGRINVSDTGTNGLGTGHKTWTAPAMG